MKNAIIILCSLTIFSCYRKNKSDISQQYQVEKPAMTDKEFIEKLIKTDFFIYADSSINNIPIDSLNAYDEKTNKFAHIDAEELAEFSLDFFTPQLTKMLEKRNIKLIIKKTINTKKLNEININNKNVVLYTKYELENDIFWNSSSINFFTRLNQILKEKNSNEKFYLINDGNDLSTLLLTNSQYNIFIEKHKANPNEIPRIP